MPLLTPYRSPGMIEPKIEKLCPTEWYSEEVHIPAEVFKIILRWTQKSVKAYNVC